MIETLGNGPVLWAPVPLAVTPAGTGDAHNWVPREAACGDPMRKAALPVAPSWSLHFPGSHRIASHRRGDRLAGSHRPGKWFVASQRPGDRLVVLLKRWNRLVAYHVPGKLSCVLPQTGGLSFILKTLEQILSVPPAREILFGFFNLLSRGFWPCPPSPALLASYLWGHSWWSPEVPWSVSSACPTGKRRACRRSSQAKVTHSGLGQTWRISSSQGLLVNNPLFGR